MKETKEFIINHDQGLQLMVVKAENVVVGIQSTSGARIIEGSGFVATSDGFILTLASVVPQGYETRVYLESGEEFVVAEVIKRDFRQDLAVLKIEKRNLQPAGFVGADSIKLGAPVVMVANS